MSGFGERFRRAGYEIPKPLISLEGKPIVAHVIAMFPGETDFIFVCNQEHLDEPSYRMAETLRHYCPSGQVVGILPHKLGPVHAVQQVAHLIRRDAPVIVNYCDFTCYWDWENFKHFVTDSGCVGAIPAYRGFHPHTLGNTNYAYLREVDGWVQDIQEKQPYTSNRMEEFASSGTYYFQSGAIMLQAFAETKALQRHVGGEYYVSLCYKPLLAANQPVAVYPLQHFMQWGTPEDVSEYQMWSETFHALGTPSAPASAMAPSGSVIVPMAGLGQRFANEGYALAKPLISVSGKHMVDQATADLPAAQRHAFVLRSDMPGYDAVRTSLELAYAPVVIETVDQVTRGQACSALVGLDALEKGFAGQDIGPVTFGACDNGALYDARTLHALLADERIDVIVWAVRGHVNALRHPTMFGWIDADVDDGRIRRISVKESLANPATDPIVIGTFTFRRAGDARRSIAQLIANNRLVNGEFYLDSTINEAIALGLNCHLFEVESFISWGTPNDLKIFEYWQSCFDKWEGHSYKMEADTRIPPEAIDALRSRYGRLTPSIPAPRS